MAPPPPPPAADIAVARKLLADNALVIALVPAGTGLDSWPVLLRLARAIAFVAPKPIGLVRAPDASAPPRPSEGRPGPADAFRIVDLPSLAVAPPAAIAELILPPAVGLYESAAHLGRAIERARSLYAHLLCAFEGYVPDVAEALELPDVFVSAARAGATRESDLTNLVELLPASRHLGTLLVE